MVNTEFWADGIAELVPYVPGEQPRIANLVKLNTNENPFPPSPKVQEAIAQASAQGLQLYPDPESRQLCQALAAYHRQFGITPEHVFVGNGSDEVLAHAFKGLFVRAGKPLLMPDISYSFYKVYCDLFGIVPKMQPLDAQWQINVADYAAHAASDVAGVVIANPNAPTGIAMPLKDIRLLLQAFASRPVLVDEAYVDFGGESAIALVNEFPNLIVTHTLSKSRSLAGLRVGFAVAQPHLIEALVRVKDSFNSYPLDKLAQAGAQAAYADEAYFRQCTNAIIQTRQRLVGQLQQRGFEVLPSAANFVFARHARLAGADIFAALRERAVLVRHFAKPRIEDFLRITIGTDAQCDKLLAALDDFLEQKA